jgi:hypothetical protein
VAGEQTRQNLAILLVGILIGGLMFLAGPSPAGTGDRLRKLEKKVATLQKKTQLMDKQGGYGGPIFGFQVLSFCAPATGAVWEPSEVVADLSQIDDCFVAARSRQQELRKALRLLDK